MRLLDAMRHETTGMRRPNGFLPKLTAVYGIEKTGNPCSSSVLFAEEYEMRGTIAVRFCANNAQYDQAAEQARRHLVQAFYTEVLVGLVELRSAVMDGDAREALAIIDRLQKDMGA